MARLKRRMTEQQEFEIMKLVMDKFLWLGFIVMGWGLFSLLREGQVYPGVWYLIAGASLLIVFVLIIIKEYEVLK
jgi:hypothetical protein